MLVLSSANQDGSTGGTLRRVFIVGKDWQLRSLLRAQLLEEGFDAKGYEDVADALSGLNAGGGLPDLLVTDVSAGDAHDTGIAVLSKWAKKVPVWVIASRSYQLDERLSAGICEKVLMRPVDLGTLVAQIKQRLARYG